MITRQKNNRAKWLLSLAALVLLMSDVYVGRAQLEIAWENTNYHYQYFNRYKKVIQAEGCFVDMKTGKIIYKYDSVRYDLTPDGSRLFTYKRIDKSDTVVCTIYDFDSFQKLDTFKYISGSKGLVIHGVTMNNNVVYYNDGKSAVIFWDIKTKKILDTIQYKTPVFNVITSPSNYEFTHDGRYMAFQYHTTSDQGHSGEYFVILDLQTKERIFVKSFPYYLFRELISDLNLLMFTEKIKDKETQKDIFVLQIFDLNKREFKDTIKLRDSTNSIVAITQDNKYAVLSSNSTFRFFDIQQNKLLDYIYKVNDIYKNSYFNDRIIFCDDTMIYLRNQAYKFDKTLDIDDNMRIDNEITVFPNPSGSFINLKLPDNKIPKKWEIIDMRGNVLLKNINSISNDIKIDITQLAPETYILRIYTDKTVMNFKIIRE